MGILVHKKLDKMNHICYVIKFHNFINPKYSKTSTSQYNYLDKSYQSELLTMACRKNAKKEKATRNRIAARRFSHHKIKKLNLFEKKAELTNYVTPFRYTAEKSESEAAKIVRK